MAELWEEKEKEFTVACKKLGLPVKVAYAPFQDNVPNVEMTNGKPKGLTIHETGNFNIGSRAMSQRNWVVRHHGGSDLASFTMSVDDGQCVLICRLNYRNNHAGRALGNATHGSIEICVNADRDATKTNENGAKAAAAYLHIWDLPASVIVQHNFWYGKNCPSLLRQRGWPRFLMNVDKYLAELVSIPPPVVDPIRHFPLTGHILYGEFRKFFEKHGDVPAFGFPITDTTQERIGGKVYPYVQWFERARMEWDPDSNKVQLGLIGKELLESKGRPVVPEVAVAPRFTKYYDKHGGVEIFGLAIEGERLEEMAGKFYIVQYFERARLEWEPQTQEITRGLVGVEARSALQASVPDAPGVA